MTILHSTPEDINRELSTLFGISYEEAASIPVSYSCTRIHQLPDVVTEDSINAIYREPMLDLKSYVKILMHTNISRRPLSVLGAIAMTCHKKCLDYGSGIGTHAIALKQNNNETHILDVDGPLKEIAMKRAELYGIRFDRVYSEQDTLPENYFDLVVCLDVLEHVFDPLAVIQNITATLVSNGILCIEISDVVDDQQGHFQFIQDKIYKEVFPFIEKHYVRLENHILRKTS